MLRRSTICFIASVVQLLAVSPSPPPALPSGSGDWGDFVYYYTPASPQSQIQSDFDTVFDRNKSLIQPEGQFLTQGYAFLFATGTYSQVLNLQLGYYMSVMGLGTLPQNTSINSINSYNASSDPCVGALRNYWRSAENFRTVPAQSSRGSTAMVWAASHGSWLRNIRIFGRLYLSEFDVNATGTTFTPVGASNGAFLANCDVNNWILSDPNITRGSAIYSAQRQLLTRNLDISTLLGSNRPVWQGVGSSIWAQTFLGCHAYLGTPSDPTSTFATTFSSVCSNCPSPNPSPSNICECSNGICPINATCSGLPATVIARTPTIAEKPWIAYDGANFSLIIPNAKSNVSGFSTLLIPDQATKLPFQNNVYVATPADTADFINNYLAQPPSAGQTFRAVILTPGTYSFASQIQITQPNTVLLGIGFPTLIAPIGKPCIVVDPVDGVRIGGIIVQAGRSPGKNTSLLQWGSAVDEGPNSFVRSGYLYDFCARVGRFDNQDPTYNSSPQLIAILSASVVCDNVWAWRADLDAFGSIDTNTPVPRKTCLTGIYVAGEDVTMYGMASENTFENLTEWHGKNGSSYSYQGVFPPDGKAPGQYYAFTGYQVDTNVTHHEAFDTGIYSQIYDVNRDIHHGIEVLSGISTPNSSGIHFFNAFTRILNGNSLISAVLPNSGETNSVGGVPVSYVSPDAPGPAYLINCEWGGPDEPNAAPLSAAAR